MEGKKITSQLTGNLDPKLKRGPWIICLEHKIIVHLKKAALPILEQLSCFYFLQICICQLLIYKIWVASLKVIYCALMVSHFLIILMVNWKGTYSLITIYSQTISNCASIKFALKWISREVWAMFSLWSIANEVFTRGYHIWIAKIWRNV